MYLISYKTYYKLNIMIEKSLYENYQIDFDETITPDSEDYLFVFNENRELYLDDDEKLPKSLDNFDINFCLYIGTYCDKKAFAANVKTEEEYCNLADVYEFNHDLYHIASRAVLVNDWYNIFQYCGHCGAKNVIDEKDMMMKCLECGQVHYPRIAPAIIVAITKDDKLLMARHSYHKNHPYTIIAGFVEPGENLEEAVEREIDEEVGIKVKNITYQKSQSWPFPNSLMIGFTAEYESGELKIDDDELIEAKWFSRDEIKNHPSDISISHWLIDNFING